MKCPYCGGDRVMITGNEWECDACGEYGSFLSSYQDGSWDGNSVNTGKDTTRKNEKADRIGGMMV